MSGCAWLVLTVCQGGGEEPRPALEGEVTLGLRLRELGGSSAQYAEDVNLEEGLFLRSARVEARGLRGLPLERLELSAFGVGDPFSSYRLEALGGPWRTDGRYDRDRFVGSAQADQHAFDLERERGSLDFEYRPDESATRSTVGVVSSRREGLYQGTRSFNHDFVSGFPELREEVMRGVRGGFATEAGAYALDLELDLYTLAAEDRVSFAVPAPDYPAETVTEDAVSDTDAIGRNGSLGLERELSSGARLALDLEWHLTDLEGDLSLFETGFFFEPGLPYERSTTGDLEIEGREIEGGAGISFPLSDAADLDLRWSRRVEREDGDLARTVVLDELMGDPPSVSTFLDRSELDSDLDLLELVAETRPADAVSLDVALEWGSEKLEVLQVAEGETLRSFDGRLKQFGGEVGASFELGLGVSLDVRGGHRVRPTETTAPGVGFGFDDDRATFAHARCKWRRERCTISGEARLEHRESEPLTSEGDVGRYGFGCSGAIGEHTSFGVHAALVAHDLESETTVLFQDPSGSISVVPAVATFEEHMGLLSGQVEHTFAELQPRFGWSLALAQGASEFEYLSAAAELPWEFRPGFELGLAVRWLDFDGTRSLDASDYRAFMLELYLRRAFGPFSL